MQTAKTFPNYLQMRQWLPIPVWHSLRLVSVGVALGLCMLLIVRPTAGLWLFWRVMVPCLPLLFFVAPGLWRNICPLAAMNQTPRLFQLSRSLTLPRWMQEYGYIVAITLFLLLAPARKLLFNTSGVATALLILVALLGAFLMGNLFKGKSGWCSSICPLLPVQRIYGQTPFLTIPNSHCQPCVGCTKNCYDFNPRVAYLADLHDPDRHSAAYRKFFVGLFPGFVLAYYTLPNAPAIAPLSLYGQMALYALVSVALFFAADSFVKTTSNKITVLFGAAALNLYYWFNAVVLASLVAFPAPLWLIWALRAFVFALTLIWIYRTYQKEQNYIELILTPQSRALADSQVSLVSGQAGPSAAPNGGASQGAALNGGASHGAALNGGARDSAALNGGARDSAALNGGARDSAALNGGAKNNGAIQSESPTVLIEGKRIVVEKGKTLLEIVEANGLPIEAGCRMGVCGADPVCIVKGMEKLSKVSSDERTTLERLGRGENTRMACVTRVRGDVTVSLKAAPPQTFVSSIVAGFPYDKSVKKVVIVGNGIAGVTAADHVRRRHPSCEIHLIGRERHHLYNRMGITRLIYGRSAMSGLYLMPEKWYDDCAITTWLNTHVAGIDKRARQVTLGTGETLAYDRLILTTGSQSFVPPIAGYGLPGSFVLREAEDAMAIRAFVQEQGCRQGVVAGGGLLGLEAAYALHKLGLSVTVLERSTALLRRQLDEAGARYLRQYLEGVGLHIVTEAESAALHGQGRVQEVTLQDGRTLPCDLFLVAAGIRAEVGLATQMGLTVKRGVVVDAQMRTSDPAIFAAGDVAEFNGQTLGLWPIAVSQAETAAANAVAPRDAALASYHEMVPVTMLKVAGVDLTSIGRIEVAQGMASESNECEIVFAEAAENRYRKLVIAGGKVVGAILLGYPALAPAVAEISKQGIEITRHLPALRNGDWDVLKSLVD